MSSVFSFLLLALQSINELNTSIGFQVLRHLWTEILILTCLLYYITAQYGCRARLIVSSTWTQSLGYLYELFRFSFLKSCYYSLLNIVLLRRPKRPVEYWNQDSHIWLHSQVLTSMKVSTLFIDTRKVLCNSTTTRNTGLSQAIKMLPALLNQEMLMTSAGSWVKFRSYYYFTV